MGDAPQKKEKFVTHVAYRTALANIAAAEADGENVAGDIARLSGMTDRKSVV